VSATSDHPPVRRPCLTESRTSVSRCRILGSLQDAEDSPPALAFNLGTHHQNWVTQSRLRANGPVSPRPTYRVLSTRPGPPRGTPGTPGPCGGSDWSTTPCRWSAPCAGTLTRISSTPRWQVLAQLGASAVDLVPGHPRRRNRSVHRLGDQAPGQGRFGREPDVVRHAGHGESLGHSRANHPLTAVASAPKPFGTPFLLCILGGQAARPEPDTDRPPREELAIDSR
jgi:hypothetical protein